MSRTFTIDGTKFSSLKEFYETFGKEALQGVSWGKNLDAFDDALSGGVGAISPGDTVIWRFSTLSRLRLGYDETVRSLEAQLRAAHPSQHASIKEALEEAKAKRGETAFDWLVAILREHPDIELRLE